MSALIKLEASSLSWQKAGPGPTFHLVAREGVAARLVFTPEEGGFARLETAGGAWTLRHSHFPDSSVTLREAGAKTDLAVFHPHLLWNGKLVFQDGETFEWVRLGGIHPGAAFQDADGLPLAHLSLAPDGTSPLAPQQVPLAQVDLAHPHRHPADPALLASIGWFLLQFEAQLEDPGVAAETSLRM